jgi:hypothetical protein
MFKNSANELETFGGGSSSVSDDTLGELNRLNPRSSFISCEDSNLPSKFDPTFTEWRFTCSTRVPEFQHQHRRLIERQGKTHIVAHESFPASTSSHPLQEEQSFERI